MSKYLLNFWLHFVFMSTMFFAAGASAIADVGAGGGDAGSEHGTDGGGAGSFGESDDTSNESAADDTGVQRDESDPANASADDNNNADPTDSVDTGGRTVAEQDKKLIALAQKAGPEAAKRQKQLIFAEARLLKAIPGGVNGAIELVRAVEEFGGVEGIEQLQADIETYKSDSELFERGDPKWIESSFSENPDASLKAWKHSLDYVGEKFPEEYNHVMAKVIVNDLEALPVREIHALLSGIKDNPKAAELAKALADYYNERHNLSKKVPEKKVDAREKQLTERESAAEKREMDVRFKEVNTEIFPVMKRTVVSTLEADAKALGLDLKKVAAEYPGEFRSMMTEIHKRIMAAAAKDERFIDKHYSKVKKGDIKGAVAAVNAKHEKIIPDVVREVVKEYGILKGAKKKGATDDKGQDQNGNQNQNDAQNQGWQRVSKRPENSAINWAKTSGAMQLDGKYILNDGKKVVVQY